MTAASLQPWPDTEESEEPLESEILLAGDAI
jgi:hypothetical protein